jgi:ADP-ribose pyrophosphatase YjhB (NUDIX family)
MPRRAARLASAFASYAKIAWWGLVAPRTPLERRALVIVQAVVLREGEGARAGAARDPGEGRAAEVLLAVRSDLVGWELPGGTPEHEEDLEAALIREVQEETGLEVTIERHVGDYVREGFRPHTARVYVCRAVGGTPRGSTETLEVGWHPIDALPEELFPWYHQPLFDALEERSEPVVRRERHGIAAIWAGMKIDLRMRMR